MSEQERELGWDEEIEKDGGEFILLPEGDYDFTVKKFERGRFQGSAKMPPCNQAKLQITVHSPEHGDVTLNHNLLLHTKTEGFVSNFFAGIGQKKKGERVKMNWNAVTGAKGRLKLEQNTFQGNDGQQRTNNEIKKFYPYEELQQASQPQQQPQSQPQQPQQPAQHQQPFPTGDQNGNFTPGQF